MQSKIQILKYSCSKCLIALATLFVFSLNGQQQIANYISNGGFENTYNCFNPILNNVKLWRSIDSSNSAIVGVSGICLSSVPYASNTFQWPRNGNNYSTASFFCQPPINCPVNADRGYLRNRLKVNLIAGKTYCVKFYVNVSNASTYGISNIGAYFGDNTLDTITQCTKPLTYIIPQVENPLTNVVTDTLGWALITGTFVANGTEKHCVIGNFKNDANTNKVLINPTNLPALFCDIQIDDVSCIPTDLPAYAGPDLWAIPGQTVYIGRTQDVGIDEACTWYNMSNTLTPIANVAGMTLTVALSTQTYMVKQDICGIIKYDTVIVHASGLGNAELQYLNDNLKLYPQPANDFLSIETPVSDEGLFTRLSVCNAIGQAIREEELHFNNGSLKLSVADLPEGFYTLQFSTSKGYTIKKSLVVSR